MCISFRDGPAAGATLMLKRAPVFIRVAIQQNGGVDALDQLTDEPEPGETLHAYRRITKPSPFHIRCGRGSRSGWYVMADYVVCEDQPEAETMADTDRWRDWCLSQPKPKEEQ